MVTLKIVGSDVLVLSISLQFDMAIPRKEDGYIWLLIKLKHVCYLQGVCKDNRPKPR